MNENNNSFGNNLGNVENQNNVPNDVNLTQQVNTLNGVNPNENQQLNQNATMEQTQPNMTNNAQVDTLGSVNQVQMNQSPQMAQPDNNNQVNNVMPNNYQMNNNVGIEQNQVMNNNQNVDEELLKAFIGKNYEKITTRPFNFAGFFFTSFYMFYRKMFGYALLLFLINLIILNIIDNFIVSLLFNIVVGLFFNKFYVYITKKKIAKIKQDNPQRSLEELKLICENKGGTSVGKIFLGLLAEFGISLVVVIVMTIIGFGSILSTLVNSDNWNLDNWNINVNENNENKKDENTNNPSSQSDKTFLENTKVTGHSCFNLECQVYIEDVNGNEEYYKLDVLNSDLFVALDDYEDYIKLNIYFTQNGTEKTINDYKIFIKSTNEDISSVKTEDDLREKLGLYKTGIHTASLTLLEVGTQGYGYDDDTSYTYRDYTFVNENYVEFEMRYINDDGSLNLTRGSKYNVTFEVKKGTFDYEYIIKSIS